MEILLLSITNKKILIDEQEESFQKQIRLQICDLINKNVKLKDDVEFSVKPTIGHRVILHFRKKHCVLGENITNTDPAYEKINGIGIAKSNSKDELYVIHFSNIMMNLPNFLQKL